MGGLTAARRASLELSSLSSDPITAEFDQISVWDERGLVGNLAFREHTPIEGAVANVGSAREIVAAVVVCEVADYQLSGRELTSDLFAWPPGILADKSKRTWRQRPGRLSSTCWGDHIVVTIGAVGSVFYLPGAMLKL
jgi:hypothetical protein